MASAERGNLRRRAPRLLIISDCTAVLQEVQGAWDRASAWRLNGHHRQAILEQISLRRARWVRAGGEVVFQWTPAHVGVYPNHYADVLAKAYLGRDVAGAYAEGLHSRATLVQYGLQTSLSREPCLSVHGFLLLDFPSIFMYYTCI